MRRLTRSAAELDFEFDEDGAREQLQHVAFHAPENSLRLRLVLWRDGECEVTREALLLQPTGAVWNVAIAERKFHSAMPLLRHKTTRRALYEDELAHARQAYGADEVIFLNERGEICEGARTNVFLRRDGVLATPPLASGLLPGVLRASLLASGEAREAVLRQGDLARGELFMGNSVRGLVAARLIAAAPA